MGGLFPLNSAGWLRRNVENHSIDFAHFIRDAAGDLLQQVVRQPGPVRRHGIGASLAALLAAERLLLVVYGFLADAAAIAALWKAWEEHKAANRGDVHDVWVKMLLMKAARMGQGELNIDDYADAAGYASCAYEAAVKHSKRMQEF